VAAVSEVASARLVTRSARATHALGARLGRLLAPGDVVALVGDLGAGKTQLVRGACAGAGVRPEEVSSPSFAIVVTYEGRIPVHHADLYRIGDMDELYGTGFGDLVGGEGALLVEWADRVPGALPEERLTVRLGHDARAPDVRHLSIEGVGPRHAALARKLARRVTRPRVGARSTTRSKSTSKSTTKTKTKTKAKARARARATRSR
jgi:tRNA threonylcarbamoyladenosine biosynthesis protein TsaE